MVRTPHPSGGDTRSKIGSLHCGWRPCSKEELSSGEQMMYRVVRWKGGKNHEIYLKLAGPAAFSQVRTVCAVSTGGPK